jgi:hypothetical protein
MGGLTVIIALCSQIAHCETAVVDEAVTMPAADTPPCPKTGEYWAILG